MVLTTWSNSCLPVVVCWIANSSSASIVVTRTFIYEKQNKRLNSDIMKKFFTLRILYAICRFHLLVIMSMSCLESILLITERNWHPFSVNTMDYYGVCFIENYLTYNTYWLPNEYAVLVKQVSRTFIYLKKKKPCKWSQMSDEVFPTEHLFLEHLCIEYLRYSQLSTYDALMGCIINHCFAEKMKTETCDECYFTKALMFFIAIYRTSCNSIHLQAGLAFDRKRTTSSVESNMARKIV